MGSVSSLITGGKDRRLPDHRLKKGDRSKRGPTKNGSAFEPAANGEAKLSRVSGNTDDFFYIRVSQRPRAGEEVTEENTGLRRTAPTELKLSARPDQALPQCSSSSVETHNSLRTILGTGPSPTNRSKAATPEPKLDLSSGSPSDSGISGSSWTGGVNTEDRGSNPGTRSASVLSDPVSRADRRIRDRRSPFSDLSSGSTDELVMERSVEDGQSEKLLQMRVVQLQEETKRLKEEMDRLLRERDPVTAQLTPTLEETQWEVCQKAGEISLLKQQLKDSQADVAIKLSEIVALKSALRDARRELKELEEKNQENQEALKSRRTEMEVCENELQRKKNEADLLREKVLKLESDLRGLRRDLTTAREERLELSVLKVKLQEQQDQLQIQRSEENQADALQEDVARLRDKLEKEKKMKEKILESFRHEKQTWNKEKEKVIRYQKQLQFSYQQINRRNQDLERMLRELKVGLRSKADVGMDVQRVDHRD